MYYCTNYMIELRFFVPPNTK